MTDQEPTEEHAKAPSPAKPDEIATAYAEGEISKSETLEMIADLDQEDGKILARELVVASQYEGPMPSPSMLAHYEEIVPGRAAKIVENFQTESDHRRSLETKVVASESESIPRGQFIGLGGLVSILGTGLIALGMGSEATAVAALAVGGVGIVSALVKGRNGS